MCLQTLYSKFLPLVIGQQLLVLSRQITTHELGVVNSPPFISDHDLQVLILCSFNLKLLSESTGFDFEVINLLGHVLFIVIKLGAHSLKAFFVVLNIYAHGFVVINLDFKFVTFFLSFAHGLMSKFYLMGQVIDVPLQSFNLSDVVLLLLLQLLDGKLRASHAFLHF